MSAATTRDGRVRLEAGGGLVLRALDLLAGAPLPTTEVAVRVLGLTGDATISARAVWTLLGDDARFAVSPEGVWSLAGPTPPPPGRLDEQRWTVVDVETTGGSPAGGHRVTEVAAVCVEGGEIRETYATLVNPGRSIPAYIASLTGISDAMVSGAPDFGEVVPRVEGLLRGRVFVAHNAGFDWRFVSAEVERTSGRAMAGRQLCTVKLARKLLPHLPSRSLGALADFYGLSIHARHRALDDAVATARILLLFLEMLEEHGVADWPALDALLNPSSRRRAKRRALPHSVDRA